MKEGAGQEGGGGPSDWSIHTGKIRVRNTCVVGLTRLLSVVT